MKYAPGDFLSGKDLVYMEIVAAIDGEFPTYATYSPKSKNIQWQTEMVLDKLGFAKATPDFAKYEKVKPGDMIRIRHDVGSAHMHRILTRLDNMILLSHQPIQHKEAAQQQHLRDQLNDLVEDFDKSVEDDRVKIHIKELKDTLVQDPVEKLATEFLTGRNAYDVAGDWMTVRDLALMNWELLATDE